MLGLLSPAMNLQSHKLHNSIKIVRFLICREGIDPFF